jgi:hypothetical protein
MSANEKVRLVRQAGVASSALEVCRSAYGDADAYQSALDHYYSLGYEEAEEPNHPSAEWSKYQKEALSWASKCFGPTAPFDLKERRDRFLEEALELYQATGGALDEAAELCQYVYGRPVGEVDQEVGGVGLTLSLLCSARGLDLGTALDTELARVWGKIEKIRIKQAAKPHNSPLPGPSAPEPDKD